MVAFETPLPIVQGIAEAQETDPFRDALLNITGISLDATVREGTTFAKVDAGTINFGFGVSQQAGVPGMDYIAGFPFGLEPPEHIAWYKQAGRAIQLANYATAGKDVVPFAVGVRSAESGGWWRSPITMKMLRDGVYPNGQPIAMRLAGLGAKIMNKVFPNVSTPPATPGAATLDDWKNNVYTALEFGIPELDAHGGLFPNFPLVDDSIIANGATDYYVSAWWQPLQTMEVWVNKTYFDAQSTAIKDGIAQAADVSLAAHLQLTYGGVQGTYVKNFQDMGVNVHKAWPRDVMDLCREAADLVDAEEEAADGTGGVTDMLDSLKAYAQSEQVRLNNAHGRRSDRFKLVGWAPDVVA
jgi:TRAP-type mannitol/chloroaromatic compound transport system substrate-binding protein